MSERNYPDKFRIYIDLDGVLADFEHAMNRHGLPAKQVKLFPGTYSHIPMMPHAQQGVKELLGLGAELFVCTKIPDDNPYSAAEKLIWVKLHFPELHGRVIITPDKGCIGTARDYLIDDHPEWANAHNFAGTVIKFVERGTHTQRNGWPEIAQYFKYKSVSESVNFIGG